jgi:hypothetical protein
MKISTHIDKNNKIRSHKVEGELTLDGVKEQLNKIYSSTDFESDMNVIWDLREAGFSSMDASGVRSVMEYVSRNWGESGKSKGALVVSRDLDFGLSRMYEMLMESVSTNEIRVFKDIDEAKIWIGG